MFLFLYDKQKFANQHVSKIKLPFFYRRFLQKAHNCRHRSPVTNPQRNLDTLPNRKVLSNIKTVGFFGSKSTGQRIALKVRFGLLGIDPGPTVLTQQTRASVWAVFRSQFSIATIFKNVFFSVFKPSAITLRTTVRRRYSTRRRDEHRRRGWLPGALGPRLRLRAVKLPTVLPTVTA